MKYDIYNQNGEKTGTTLLPKEIFDVKINPDLVYQVVTSQTSNRRQVLAHAKDRSEVRGGGKKPWPQKGTGRARHASIRSPLWRGGGVTFGPTKNRNFKKEINKKMKTKALLMVLSAKVKDNLLIVLEELKIEKPKTKLVVEILKKLPVKGTSLIVLPGLEKDIIRAAKNISGTQTMEARNINALDLLSVKYLIMPKDSIKKIQETFI